MNKSLKSWVPFPKASKSRDISVPNINFFFLQGPDLNSASEVGVLSSLYLPWAAAKPRATNPFPMSLPHIIHQHRHLGIHFLSYTSTIWWVPFAFLSVRLHLSVPFLNWQQTARGLSIQVAMVCKVPLAPAWVCLRKGLPVFHSYFNILQYWKKMKSLLFIAIRCWHFVCWTVRHSYSHF